jgi:uncharacterized membrane protein YeiH
MDLFGVLVIAVITGVGGELLRDVPCAEVPLILGKEIYATASMVGTATYAPWMSWHSRTPRSPSYL